MKQFRQTPAVHISDHFHERSRHRSLCKAKLDDQFLLDLFLKTLTTEISKDMGQKNPTSEEDAINKAQKLELIYTQS